MSKVVETHECPHPRCGQQLPMHLFACKPHWHAIPRMLRTALNRAWENVDSDMATYLRARGECVAFLQTLR